MSRINKCNANEGICPWHQECEEGKCKIAAVARINAEARQESNEARETGYGCMAKCVEEMSNSDAILDSVEEAKARQQGTGFSIAAVVSDNEAVQKVFEDAYAEQSYLSSDSQERKETPIFTGVVKYFPLALAAIARVSKKGNDKHNPGEPLHWARGKSMDQLDACMRHLVDADGFDPDGEPHLAHAGWRILAELQLFEEKRLNRK